MPRYGEGSPLVAATWKLRDWVNRTHAGVYHSLYQGCGLGDPSRLPRQLPDPQRAILELDVHLDQLHSYWPERHGVDRIAVGYLHPQYALLTVTNEGNRRLDQVIARVELPSGTMIDATCRPPSPTRRSRATLAPVFPPAAP